MHSSKFRGATSRSRLPQQQQLMNLPRSGSEAQSCRSIGISLNLVRDPGDQGNKVCAGDTAAIAHSTSHSSDRLSISKERLHLAEQ